SARDQGGQRAIVVVVVAHSAAGVWRGRAARTAAARTAATARAFATGRPTAATAAAGATAAVAITRTAGPAGRDRHAARSEDGPGATLQKQLAVRVRIVLVRALSARPCAEQE